MAADSSTPAKQRKGRVKMDIEFQSVPALTRDPNQPPSGEAKAALPAISREGDVVVYPTLSFRITGTLGFYMSSAELSQFYPLSTHCGHRERP